MKGYIDAARFYSEQFMPSALQVVRREYVSDGMGGGYFVETVLAETVCRLEGIGADEAAAAGSISTTATAKVSLPLAVTVEDTDTLKVDGTKYNVAGVLPHSPGHAAHLEVLVERVG